MSFQLVFINLIIYLFIYLFILFYFTFFLNFFFSSLYYWLISYFAQALVPTNLLYLNIT